MITELDFEKIIMRPESTTLDFKREQYKIINDESGIKTAEFIKDIISFANTIRTETAYIIIGISNDINEKELLGINQNIDDAIFQEKIKDKVNPKPVFLYFTIKYKGKDFGVFEIPVTKYAEPIASVQRMKGLEPGKIYFRRGSSNAEAIGREIININNWLESLPSVSETLSLNDEISALLTRATSQKELLSSVISDTYRVAKKHHLITLEKFCSGELSGWKDAEHDESTQKYINYRLQSILVSVFSVGYNHENTLGAQYIYNEIKKMDHVYEKLITFTEPISTLEHIVNQFSHSTDMIISKSITSSVFSGDKNDDFPMTMYALKDNFQNLYHNIRQKLIDELLAV